MIKRLTLLTIIFALIVASSYTLIVNASKNNPLYEKFTVNFKEIEYSYDDKDKLLAAIVAEEARIDAAMTILDVVDSLSAAGSIHVKELVSEELQEAVTLVETGMVFYELLVEDYEAKWAIRESEYPAASYVWQRLKAAGYNDYVCAGIMGNLMAECGGQTLDLHYWMYDNDKSHFGMCQWSKDYKEIWNASLEDQCDFLLNNIEYEIDLFGFEYQKYFDYNRFLEITNEKEAALAFSRCYERCGPTTEKVRKTNATFAYNYFAY